MSAILLAGWAGCTRPAEPPSTAILLVTLDGVRADRADAVPSLGRLAAKGVSYADAQTASPLTQPALASILTGLPPFAHGVRDDGDFALAPERSTVAERLREAGWTTIATQDSALTDSRFGLHQGFDTVLRAGARDPVFPDEALGASPVASLAALLPTLPARTFVWAHLGGPAWPFVERSEEERLAALEADLSALLGAWDARYGDRSVVAVTADHGVPDGELGERHAGLLLHDATLRVPLVVRGAPELGHPGDVVHGAIGTVDLAGTLLVAAGQDPRPVLPLVADPWRPVYAESRAGRFLFGTGGLSSLTDAKGRTIAGQWVEHCVAPEGPCTLDDPDPDRWLEVQGEHEEPVPVYSSLDPATLAALSRTGYVGGDPTAPGGEVDPRAAMDDIALYRRAVTLLHAGFTREASEALVVSDRAFPDAFAVRALEGQLLWQQGRLGDAEAHWLGLFSRTPTATVALALARVESARGRWVDAARWFEEARRLDPDSRAAFAGHLRARYEAGEHELVDELSTRYLAANDDQGALAPVRAELLVDQQQLDAAEEEALRGVTSMPDSAWAHMALARVRWERGAADAAVADARRAVALDPYAAPLRLRLGTWLLELGANPEAVRVLAPAARILTDDAGAKALYERARAAVTEEDQLDLRIERAHGPG